MLLIISAMAGVIASVVVVAFPTAQKPIPRPAPTAPAHTLPMFDLDSPGPTAFSASPLGGAVTPLLVHMDKSLASAATEDAVYITTGLSNATAANKPHRTPGELEFSAWTGSCTEDDKDGIRLPIERFPSKKFKTNCITIDPNLMYGESVTVRTGDCRVELYTDLHCQDFDILIPFDTPDTCLEPADDGLIFGSMIFECFSKSTETSTEYLAASFTTIGMNATASTASGTEAISVPWDPPMFTVLANDTTDEMIRTTPARMINTSLANTPGPFSPTSIWFHDEVCSDPSKRFKRVPPSMIPVGRDEEGSCGVFDDGFARSATIETGNCCVGLFSDADCQVRVLDIGVRTRKWCRNSPDGELFRSYSFACSSRMFPWPPLGCNVDFL